MRALFLITVLSLTALPSAAQSETTITYQGQLEDASGPFTGTPGMEFRLFDSLTEGGQIGTEIVLSAVPVTDGLFQVELDFGAPYGASPTYLEVMVGGETLEPRQRISAAPLAVHALSLDAAYGDNRFWKLDGNSGTTPGTDILGTTDDTPLEVHVNGVRALRLEPGDGPNVIAGSAANQVASGVRGASVAGGWDLGGNFVAGDFGTISGGADNLAGAPDGNENTRGFATVSGGTGNTANDAYATVGGGINNLASGYGAMVGGGAANTASKSYATVGGGFRNTASGEYSFAAGNRAKANHRGAFVWADSTTDDFASTGNDQLLVRAAGGVGIGTNSPTRDLHIKQRSTDNAGIGLQIERSGASTNNWGLYIATTDNLGFRYNDVLKSRIDADDGVYSTSSDRNAKKDIQALSGVLSKVLELKPRTYLMKEQDESSVRSPGFIAQEVEPLFPATVTVQDGEYALKYSQITVLNTAALIELNEHFNSTMTGLESEFEKRFAALESENTDLRARVTALTAETGRMEVLVERNRALEDRLARLESLVIEQQEIAER
ncbi:tail fiber domain-containing protein [Wenzhouxiangella sp. EGI_FJ10305]|uniref:tail fiber domain-containing protein n=1 Tax=Wenzhouxiangella sp. EGI_FJ10305 TaxID=3243768 RepID=UPI0035E2EAE7